MTQKRRKTRRLICWRDCLSAILFVAWGLFCCFSSFSQESQVTSEIGSENVIVDEKQDSYLSKTPIVTKTSNDNRDNMSLSGNSYYRVLVSGIGALALVIGVFLGGVYVLKLLAPNKFSRNSDLIEIVDSCCLNRKNELLTIKWGSKLILLSSSLDRTVALSEIVDAKETERILNELQEQKKKIRQDKTLSVVNFHNLFRKKTSE